MLILNTKMTKEIHKIELANYSAPEYLITKTKLSFTLDHVSEVASELEITNNSSLLEPQFDLVLDGQEIELLSISINQRILEESEYLQDLESLTIPAEVLAEFKPPYILKIRNLVKTTNNNSMEGLYVSSGVFLTQCEPQGFRKITYCIDRPDVLSEYFVSIKSTRNFNAMLSNGNLVDSGLTGKIHYAEWHDPHPKPCYLFALVAGNLTYKSKVFTTSSGRKIFVSLYAASEVYKKELAYALGCVLSAMAWDEKHFGREYDLDQFNLVAIDDFNMGAMENKGLNIFNSSLILANLQTASDSRLRRIDAIVAHEYFHNWSGNRVTCRDWFQLCLKEGLTVFRENLYMQDKYSHNFLRSEIAEMLISQQFKEDQGPLSHPVQPKEYIEINNFYTTTVYEKGAEIMQMIARWVGLEVFKKTCSKFFDAFSDRAVTLEDFLAFFAAKIGPEVLQFKLWFDQPGTPKLTISTELQTDKQRLRVRFQQKQVSGNAQFRNLDYKPLPIPLVFSVYYEKSKKKSKQLTLKLTKAKQDIFLKLGEEGEVPFLSLNEGFAAPIEITYKTKQQEGNENRQGLRLEDTTQEKLVQNELARKVVEGSCGVSNFAENYAPLLERIFASSASVDYLFLAQVLSIPQFETINLDSYKHIDTNLFNYQHLTRFLGKRFANTWLEVYEHFSSYDANLLTSEYMGARALANLALFYLIAYQSTYDQLAFERFLKAQNMTDESHCLELLVRHNSPKAEEALAIFQDKWQSHFTAMSFWLGVQTKNPQLDQEAFQALIDLPVFQANNPNHIRAVYGGLQKNHTAYHSHHGWGYKLLQKKIIELDSENPLMAAQLLVPFAQWKKFDWTHGIMMKQVLSQVLKKTKSANLFEIAVRAIS